jgi:hypothetical protein
MISWKKKRELEVVLYAFEEYSRTRMYHLQVKKVCLPGERSLPCVD